MSSSGNSTITRFGRLNWNISQEVTSTLSAIMTWSNITGAVFELTVVVFLVVNFCYKKSIFREPYFIIYAMGCFVDAAPKVFAFITVINISRSTVMYLFSSFFGWYNANFITFWNLVLVLNRFIAIIFTFQFKRIWSRRNTTMICILLILYPFIIHCFNPSNMWCDFIGSLCPISLRMIIRSTDFEINFAYISDFSYAIISTILCTIAASKIIFKKQMKNQNVETVLLIQSFTSSVFLVLSTATGWLAYLQLSDPVEIDRSEIYREMYLQKFLLVLSRFFYNLHHFIGLLLLLIMSRNFRTKYLEFYKLKVMFKSFQKLMKRKNEITITVINPVSTTTTPRLAHKNSSFLH